MAQLTDAGEDYFAEDLRDVWNDALVAAYQEGFNDGMQLDDFDDWLDERIAEAAENESNDARHALLDVQSYLREHGYPMDGSP